MMRAHAGEVYRVLQLLVTSNFMIHATRLIDTDGTGYNALGDAFGDLFTPETRGSAINVPQHGYSAVPSYTHPVRGCGETSIPALKLAEPQPHLIHPLRNDERDDSQGSRFIDNNSTNISSTHTSRKSSLVRPKISPLRQRPDALPFPIHSRPRHRFPPPLQSNQVIPNRKEHHQSTHRHTSRKCR